MHSCTTLSLSAHFCQVKATHGRDRIPDQVQAQRYRNPNIYSESFSYLCFKRLSEKAVIWVRSVEICQARARCALISPDRWSVMLCVASTIDSFLWIIRVYPPNQTATRWLVFPVAESNYTILVSRTLFESMTHTCLVGARTKNWWQFLAYLVMHFIAVQKSQKLSEFW